MDTAEDTLPENTDFTPIYGTTLLNQAGDVVLAWDEEAAAKMTEWVQKRMDEGYTFFLVKPTMFGFGKPTKTRLKRIAELKAKGNHSISMDLALFENWQKSDGNIAITERQGGELEVENRPVKDAAEVARSASVAVKPRAGG